jgi:nucleoside-diphosphate-sugar epimerase
MKKQNKVLITGASGFVGVIFKTILMHTHPIGYNKHSLCTQPTFF